MGPDLLNGPLARGVTLASVRSENMYVRGRTKIFEFDSVALISDRAMTRVGMSFRLGSDVFRQIVISPGFLSPHW